MSEPPVNLETGQQRAERETHENAVCAEVASRIGITEDEARRLFFTVESAHLSDKGDNDD